MSKKINYQWIIVLTIVAIIIYFFIKKESMCDYKPIEAVDNVLMSGSPDRLPLPNPPAKKGQQFPSGVYTTSGIGRSFQ